MRVLNESTNIVCRFAAEELENYLKRMGNPDLSITLSAEETASPDDGWEIAVEEREGRIAGSNPRALLLAVYRYLTLIGCAFPAPGPECEIVPVKPGNTGFAARESHRCSLRHRGVCIEGADSCEDILRFIDWLPKAGYNSFFLQFENADTFMQRFYRHRENPLLPPVEWTAEDSQRMLAVYDAEMRKRGILQHRMGHGWTARVLDVSTQGWDAEAGTLPPEKERLTAMVNGKRGLWKGVAVNTNLCYSRPETREAMAELVLRYIRQNPSVDYLHVWLADEAHNCCECERCAHTPEGRPLRPADHYVDVLNAIDDTLSREGLPTKIVFLIYDDLLWAPLEKKLKNPSRFVLMFAPITRTFEASFAGERVCDAPPYELNRTLQPEAIGENLGCLKAWLEASNAEDAFDFDYYLGGAHWADPTRLGFAGLIAEDLKTHRALGLNGISSCQDLRAAFPNAVGGWIMARLSTDTATDTEEELRRYFGICYGADGEKVLRVMEELSRCYRLNASMKTLPASPEDAARLTKAFPLLRQLETLCHDHAPAAYSAQELMWRRLSVFVPCALAQTKAMLCHNLGNEEEAGAALEEWIRLARTYELSDPHANDVWRVYHKGRQLIGLPG